MLEASGRRSPEPLADTEQDQGDELVVKPELQQHLEHLGEQPQRQPHEQVWGPEHSRRAGT
jgi:hypothetical protein